MGVKLLWWNVSYQSQPHLEDILTYQQWFHPNIHVWSLFNSILKYTHKYTWTIPMRPSTNNVLFDIKVSYKTSYLEKNKTQTLHPQKRTSFTWKHRSYNRGAVQHLTKNKTKNLLGWLPAAGWLWLSRGSRLHNGRFETLIPSLKLTASSPLENGWDWKTMEFRFLVGFFRPHFLRVLAVSFWGV